jgi:hypothetical protein
MATTFACIWKNNVLVPGDEDAREALSKIANGSEIRVEIKAKRNVRRHRLLFALLKIIVDHRGDIFPATENVLDALKIASGHVDQIVHPITGEVFLKPKSIAFENMDEAEFGRFFDRAVWIFTDRWFPGTHEEDLRRELFELVDGPERSSLGKRVA